MSNRSTTTFFIHARWRLLGSRGASRGGGSAVFSLSLSLSYNIIQSRPSWRPKAFAAAGREVQADGHGGAPFLYAHVVDSGGWVVVWRVWTTCPAMYVIRHETHVLVSRRGEVDARSWRRRLLLTRVTRAPATSVAAAREGGSGAEELRLDTAGSRAKFDSRRAFKMQ